jgi:hypothetical protein
VHARNAAAKHELSITVALMVIGIETMDEHPENMLKQHSGAVLEMHSLGGC